MADKATCPTCAAHTSALERTGRCPNGCADPAAVAGSPMLTPEALEDTGEALARSRGYSEHPRMYAGMHVPMAEDAVAAFLAAQDRDALASAIAQAWIGPGRYVGDLSGGEWDAAYRVVDTLLGPAE